MLDAYLWLELHKCLEDTAFTDRCSKDQLSLFLSLFSFQLRSSTELHPDLLTDCLAVQPLQPATSPRDAADRTVGHSPGPGPELYSGKNATVSPVHLRVIGTRLFPWPVVTDLCQIGKVALLFLHKEQG